MRGVVTWGGDSRGGGNLGWGLRGGGNLGWGLRGGCNLGGGAWEGSQLAPGFGEGLLDLCVCDSIIHAPSNLILGVVVPWGWLAAGI